MTEARLIERAVEGDPLAIRTLYERHSHRVFAAIRRILGDDHLAEDVAQEAWIKALRGLPTFRMDARFGTWLHRIAVNAALQSRRSAGPRRNREADMPEQVAAPIGNGDVLLEDRIAAALEKVPERMRRVLILHDVEGYTHEEIGELMNVNAGTSKSQLFKARAKMRELLRESGTEGQQEGVEAWST